MLSQIKRTPVALIIGASILTGCNESSSSSQGADFDTGKTVDTEFNEQALITNITENIISPVFTTFKEVAVTQHQQIATYCEAVKSDSIENTLVDAQQSWRNTMLVWQQAEMMQVQPLIQNENKLRNDIYSWPDIFTCGVDQDTIYFSEGEFNGQPYNIDNRRANRKGLYALEYLLFNQSNNHSCQVTAPEGWNDLTAEQITVARCEFATEVARDVTINADRLVSAWTSFSNDIKSAGQDGSSFATAHDAINHLSDAMFYLDSITKDAKLATPLGLVSNSCGSQACPEEVESNFANHSIENLIQNLKAFDQLFTGGGENSTGFVDYLNYAGDTDTADKMTAAINTAIEQLESYQVTLAQALTTNEAQVEATHQNVKAITDELKTDFIQSLALELPKTAAGDND